MTEMEKSEAMEVTERTTKSSSFQTSQGPVGGKLDAAEVTVTERTATPISSETSARSLLEQAEVADVAIGEMAATPTSFQSSELSIEGKAEAPEITIIERTATPGSFRTSEGSLVEKALAAEDVSYLKGWRLHFLSLRSAFLNHRYCFANGPSAWLFCSFLSTSKSQSSGRP